MIVSAKYSFNNGEEAVMNKYPHLIEELTQAINAINAEDHKTKSSKEKTMRGKLLYSPPSLNKAFRGELYPGGWHSKRVTSNYSKEFYTPDHIVTKTYRSGYRDMDFLKEKLGVEVQFGKYSFMVYNVCAKMTIFKKLGFIDMGVEVVPIKQFAVGMSTGVSYFEQFVWDLEQRGVSDIDIPVLILGIDTERKPEDAEKIVVKPPKKTRSRRQAEPNIVVEAPPAPGQERIDFSK